MTEFYDQLAPFYHLIFPDWYASVRRQGEQIASLIESNWPERGPRRKVLDVSCGIGTQAIGLALQGHAVTGSDLSASAVDRLRSEAARFGVSLDVSVCDMRRAHAHHGSGFDAVICCDNSLPHLLTEDDVLAALKEMLACLSAGGGCIVTVRDYGCEARGRNLVKPYGVRVDSGKRYLLFQVWDFAGEHYDLSLFVVEEDLASGEVQTHAMRSRYYAVSTSQLCELMREAGFQDVRRIDGAFYQPVLVGTRRA
jgi:SAM-dependent methyltransferase